MENCPPSRWSGTRAAVNSVRVASGPDAHHILTAEPEDKRSLFQRLHGGPVADFPCLLGQVPKPVHTLPVGATREVIRHVGERGV